MNNYMNRVTYIKKKAIDDICCKFIEKSFKYYTKSSMQDNNVLKLIIIDVFNSSLSAAIEKHAIENIKFIFN